VFDCCTTAHAFCKLLFSSIVILLACNLKCCQLTLDAVIAAIPHADSCVFCAGVYDALKQKYLKCLLFGISEDEGGSCLMEVLCSLPFTLCPCPFGLPFLPSEFTFHFNVGLHWHKLFPGF